MSNLHELAIRSLEDTALVDERCNEEQFAKQFNVNYMNKDTRRFWKYIGENYGLNFLINFRGTSAFKHLYSELALCFLNSPNLKRRCCRELFGFS
jgi:hypothetical protein